MPLGGVMRAGDACRMHQAGPSRRVPGSAVRACRGVMRAGDACRMHQAGPSRRVPGSAVRACRGETRRGTCGEAPAARHLRRGTCGRVGPRRSHRRVDASDMHQLEDLSSERPEATTGVEGKRRRPRPAVSRKAAVGWAASTIEGEIRAACHRGRMAWRSFDMADVDVRTARGFEAIGRLIRRRREFVGISQRQLEALSGVDQSVISRLETGRLRGLRWSRFARLADALGGLGETDPLPVWTRRFMPPGRDGIPSLGLDR